jgi:hypothetical protein
LVVKIYIFLNSKIFQRIVINLKIFKKYSHIKNILYIKLILFNLIFSAINDYLYKNSSILIKFRIRESLINYFWLVGDSSKMKSTIVGRTFTHWFSNMVPLFYLNWMNFSILFKRWSNLKFEHFIPLYLSKKRMRF